MVRSARRFFSLVLVLVGVVAPAGAARADVAVGTVAKGTGISADAGWAAWRRDDGLLLARAGNGGPQVTALRPPSSAPFDVGTRRGGGGAQVAWAESCSTRTHHCAVRSALLRGSRTGLARVVAHIPYGGGGSPAVAVDGSRLAYTLRSGRCDVPYVRTLPSASARRLDRGHCAKITQLDVASGYVAVLASPPVTSGSGATEARVIRWSGGPSRTLQREAQGEESNYIGSVALDGAHLFTARGGIRQANVFNRYSLSGRGASSEARAFVRLEGGFARDRGITYYNQINAYESAGGCPCVVVAGGDPWAATGSRLLIPQLTLDVSPQPVYVDSDPSAVATLTRQAVTRTAQVGTPVPVPGVRVRLLDAVEEDVTSSTTPTDSGVSGTTDAGGVVALRIPAPVAAARLISAVADTSGGTVPIPNDRTILVRSFVHMTASATRLADGRLQVTGSITPAQPGRKVRLDRKLERICNSTVGLSGSLLSPAQTGVPSGCFDRYTEDPVSTAAVSPDGSTYTLTAPASAPAGTYAVSLDSPQGRIVYPGQTTAFPAP
ncbi:hypothetical protein [Conexibacter woesei]|uniref:hypothetical protein n=1 Tax=Conexibacter woesei TaxID=191495 RepID=UPI00040F2AB0|nr:hypothetical protein [Conexibacter woesei]